MSRVVIFVCLLMLASAVVSFDLPKLPETPKLPDTPKIPDAPKLPDPSKTPDTKGLQDVGNN
ncbi:unnamed protein product [Chilo suppressalis]|uniref:Seminal fluid protein n=1 Tax=Chilo suppressalis TaxID=168631 RepID=A0ABN8B659_CHISP|nr:unnamed protein product [Chilo suppressalis]